MIPMTPILIRAITVLRATSTTGGQSETAGHVRRPWILRGVITYIDSLRACWIHAVLGLHVKMTRRFSFKPSEQCPKVIISHHSSFLTDYRCHHWEDWLMPPMGLDMGGRRETLSEGREHHRGMAIQGPFYGGSVRVDKRPAGQGI